MHLDAKKTPRQKGPLRTAAVLLVLVCKLQTKLFTGRRSTKDVIFDLEFFLKGGHAP
jgi:hypothetical protein